MRLVERAEELKRLFPWLLPTFLATLGALLLFQGIRQYKERLGFNMDAQEILVAVRGLSQGEVIQEKDVTLQKAPRKLLPVGVLLSTDLSKIVGLTIKEPVAAGSLMTWSNLEINYLPPVPSRRIALRYRALTIAVSETSSVAHAIRAGDHVDILTTLHLPGHEGPSTMNLLQNVTVLSVGGAGESSELHDYSSVTLMVLPREVGIILLALEEGKINLVLRNPEDFHTPKDLPVVGIGQLIETAFRNSIQEERNSTIEIIRGGEISLDGALP